MSYRSRKPKLRQIRTLDASVPDWLRRRTRAILNVPIADLYSAHEVGTMALQCPVSGLYHAMAESLIFEALDEAGHPCTPGQSGRIVITGLRNFATPLIRYAIGDYAKPARPAPAAAACRP